MKAMSPSQTRRAWVVHIKHHEWHPCSDGPFYVGRYPHSDVQGQKDSDPSVYHDSFGSNTGARFATFNIVRGYGLCSVAPFVVGWPLEQGMTVWRHCALRRNICHQKDSWRMRLNLKATALQGVKPSSCLESLPYARRPPRSSITELSESNRGYRQCSVGYCPIKPTSSRGLDLTIKAGF
jgi:hypothetical protein